MAPLVYTLLALSGFLDYVFFAVAPDRFTPIGAAIIGAAPFYIALREAKLRRANVHLAR